MEARQTGKVKWFNVGKGYGIITCEGGGDVYVHYRAIRGRRSKSLSAGEIVQFTLIEGKRGPEADDVRTGPEAKQEPQDDSEGFEDLI